MMKLAQSAPSRIDLKQDAERFAGRVPREVCHAFPAEANATYAVGVREAPFGSPAGEFLLRPFRSLLVPLDGSHFAEVAIPYAMEIASRADAMLEMTSVHVPAPVGVTSMEAPVIDPRFEEEAQVREDAYLTKVGRQLAQDHHLHVSTLVLEGQVAEALAERAETSGADLVVLSTHGRGAFSRFWLGSIADKLIHLLSTPILLIRPREDTAESAPVLRRILIALDRSPLSEAILEPALSLAKLVGGEVTLLTVVPPSRSMSEPAFPTGEPYLGVPTVAATAARRDQLAELDRYLTRMAVRVRAEGITVSTKVVESPTVARGILEQASSGDFDLIALATHGESGLRRAVIGSVADKVVRGSSHPVLVLRPGWGRD